MQGGRMVQALLSTTLDLPRLYSGKVRELFAHQDGLLMVTSDRLSAFDVVFREGIPNKGVILTQTSLFWARTLTACQPYHLITDDVAAMGPAVRAHAEALRGRTMLVEKLDMSPIECVVRSYLVGSGYKDYKRTGAVCDHRLPPGMQNGDRLPEPLFTPASKAPLGDHDENISFATVVETVGRSAADELRDRSLEIFARASAYAESRGLILVDTKFEFGRRTDGTLVLADEILTPDSSRYWDAAEAARTARGQTPPSFDKQIVRDYLETLDWNKAPPPPTLPAGIIERTAQRYADLLGRLTQR